MTAVDSSAPATAAERLAAFADALDDCHERAVPGGVVVSRAGWAVASARRLGTGVPVPDGSGVLAARHGLRASGSEALGAFRGALLELHRRTLRDVLDAAVARLDQRESEGSPLLGRQLVRGSVADVALALSQARDVLRLPRPTASRHHRVHRELVDAGRTALKLYGAFGFTAEGPGGLLHLTELLGDTYLCPEDPEAEAGHE
ncbi:hypothetical protein [Streptomyces albireticuli]|uniref:Acyl-CoA dehydrogenase/oxidase C-terminal domain-containing protein n=1 Tax=Streptomyces albireticuli TaxID=1940 RepID=A0A2A2DD35_9ACTN|nr:hypothetical protein [Streptomyces albireticuli]MCD9144998.1 hypothetical protein [Streptomyces albireticuli]MCD9164424.1 hypothetical protein [Streptomyces albireticuli]MCD9194135.1 hypothetical protein [Streptomyces albireticuli]PAU49425.1 hypothetical protein CK936_08205 [Streptomyces albireticuli]